MALSRNDLLRVSGTMLMILWTSACVSPRAQQAKLAPSPILKQSSVKYRKEYLLVPGDQIEVVVRGVPTASRLLAIRPDGMITLPLVDEVKAAGLSLPELREDLTNRFKQRLKDPEVNVIGTQLRQPMIYVVGDVGNAMSVPLRNVATVAEALTIAGGLRRTGATRDVAVIRLDHDGSVQAIFVSDSKDGQLGPLMQMRSFPLEADDIIFVPENGRSQVVRALDDFVSRPLNAVQGVFGLYVNFRLIQAIAQ